MRRGARAALEHERVQADEVRRPVDAQSEQLEGRAQLVLVRDDERRGGGRRGRGGGGGGQSGRDLRRLRLDFAEYELDNLGRQHELVLVVRLEQAHARPEYVDE